MPASERGMNLALSAGAGGLGGVGGASAGAALGEAAVAGLRGGAVGLPPGGRRRPRSPGGIRRRGSREKRRSCAWPGYSRWRPGRRDRSSSRNSTRTRRRPTSSSRVFSRAIPSFGSPSRSSMTTSRAGGVGAGDPPERIREAARRSLELIRPRFALISPLCFHKWVVQRGGYGSHDWESSGDRARRRHGNSGGQGTPRDPGSTDGEGFRVCGPVGVRRAGNPIEPTSEGVVFGRRGGWTRLPVRIQVLNRCNPWDRRVAQRARVLLQVEA
jgi:hypothetical protein